MVDIENRLLGIITIDDIIDVIEQEDTEDFHRMAGISSPVEETYLKTSAFTMAKQRIMWLVVLMISATFTRSGLNVVKLFCINTNSFLMSFWQKHNTMNFLFMLFFYFFFYPQIYYRAKKHLSRIIS